MLQLAVCSSFGPGWLIPRLDELYETHPDIDLQLRLYAQDPALTSEVADAFVTAYPVKTGYAAIRLVDEMLVAVQAPVEQGAAMWGPRQRLITTELQSGRIGQDWVDFCKKAGIKLADLQEGAWRQCTHYLLALEMARSGQGVALVPDFLAAKDIRSGALVPFGETLLPSKRVYQLCFKKTRSHEPRLAVLAKWFEAQAEGRATTRSPKLARRGAARAKANSKKN